MVTDLPGTFDEDKLSLMTIAGYECSKKAAQKIYDQAGITADQVNVVELHDCFSANELITYEAIGLCPEGGAGEFIDSGNNTYGGRVVVNPSGGLISKVIATSNNTLLLQPCKVVKKLSKLNVRVLKINF